MRFPVVVLMGVAGLVWLIVRTPKPRPVGAVRDLEMIAIQPHPRKGNPMKKLLCGALAFACFGARAIAFPAAEIAVGSILAAGSALAMSYITPSSVTAACTILATAEQTVLADETLANQVAGKQVVRTGATSTIANVTPTLCQQLGGVATSIAASALARAPTLPPAAVAPAAK